MAPRDSDLTAALVEELIGLAPMVIAFRQETVFSLVSLLQLALRHPELPDSGRETAETFIAAAREYFADCPTVLEIIRRGADPAHDRHALDRPQTTAGCRCRTCQHSESLHGVGGVCRVCGIACWA